MLFQRDQPFVFEAVYPSSQFDARERGARALDIARRLEDGGNRDEAVRWYKLAFRLDESLEKVS